MRNDKQTNKQTNSGDRATQPMQWMLEAEFCNQMKRQNCGTPLADAENTNDKIDL